MLIDSRALPLTSDLACEVCIVGAGFAGITIADKLGQLGFSVILLESGGLFPEVETQHLARGENVGRGYYALDACRSRVFGGGSTRWGGWCRPLDPSDYEGRSSVLGIEWPIRESALRQFYPEVAERLGLSKASFEVDEWCDRIPRPLPLEGSSFTNILFQFSDVNFGVKYRSAIESSNNVTALLHANLIDIRLTDNLESVERLDVSTLGGRSFSIRPRAVVLAAGGIENARLLLASVRDRPGGLGNHNDLVGRFFMEHLHVAAGHLIARSDRYDRRFYKVNSYDDAKVCGLIKPTTNALTESGLLAASIALEPQTSRLGAQILRKPTKLRYGGITLERKLLKNQLWPLARGMRRSHSFVRGIPQRFTSWTTAQRARAHANLLTGPSSIYALYFRAEQRPHSESRVTLSNHRDALGIPEVRLNWRVSPEDTSSITNWLERLGKDLERRDIGLVLPPVDGWDEGISGGSHHMGTTRMSANPKAGVVDEHCRVHSITNLYVAGSSVFVSSGYANPTFTILALALRLSETLGARLRH